MELIPLESRSHEIKFISVNLCNRNLITNSVFLDGDSYQSYYVKQMWNPRISVQLFRYLCLQRYRIVSGNCKCCWVNKWDGCCLIRNDTGSRLGNFKWMKWLIVIWMKLIAKRCRTKRQHRQGTPGFAIFWTLNGKCTLLFPKPMYLAICECVNVFFQTHHLAFTREPALLRLGTKLSTAINFNFVCTTDSLVPLNLFNNMARGEYKYILRSLTSSYKLRN